ncbi:hypothetical protein EKO27_g11718 [Xylaria grammica]|uniref:Heterokaryon incompatibility domain-containing protein n=1 Tax=Xylaria grammica TaxID=363999 RepID=A0A439CMK3_9PEZI|nr:hypothetical protein EKO27_g11718 [Xylaria grammica]
MPQNEPNLWGPPNELDAITRFFEEESLCDFCLRTPIVSLIRRRTSDVTTYAGANTTVTPCRLCQLMGTTEENPKVLHVMGSIDTICLYARANRLGWYIWIDSLCINQEKNGPEKLLECARMELIFRQAYCVFAATFDESSMYGLFDRPSLGQPFHIPDIPGDTSLLVRDFDRQASFERDTQNAQLNTRGWVFQERALAVHTIHFCAKEAYWECGQTTCRESPTLDDCPSESTNPLSTSYFPEPPPTDSVSAMEAFRRYSRLGLTNPSDRALAIMGLEYRLAIHLKTCFIYGIQANDAARTLLWKRSSETSMLEIPPGETAPEEIPPARAPPRVPSWSWMSRTGSIDYVRVKLDTPGTFQLKYETVPFRTGLSVAYQNTETKFFCQLKSTLHVVETEDMSVHVLDTWKGLVRAQELVGWVCFDDARSELPGTLKSMVMCSGQSEEGELLTRGDAGGECHFALLVEAEPDVDPGQESKYYRRIGVGIFVQDVLNPQGEGEVRLL